MHVGLTLSETGWRPPPPGDVHEEPNLLERARNGRSGRSRPSKMLSSAFGEAERASAAAINAAAIGNRPRRRDQKTCSRDAGTRAETHAYPPAVGKATAAALGTAGTIFPNP